MGLSIRKHPYYAALLRGRPFAELTRHDKTQIVVKDYIASLVREYDSWTSDLLEVGGAGGLQTVIYRDQLKRPGRTVIYDWRDTRDLGVREEVGFQTVDLETQRFPDSDETYDFVICSQVLEHLKNIFTPLSEMWRVLRPGGYFIVSVPNLTALHNCLLVLLGIQPTTVGFFGGHVRGFAIRSMTRFLTMNGRFRLVKLRGFGLHPITSVSIPPPLRVFCHTPVWFLQKRASDLPLWEEVRTGIPTTTNFFEGPDLDVRSRLPVGEQELERGTPHGRCGRIGGAP